MKSLMLYRFWVLAVLVGCAERPVDNPSTLDPRPIAIRSQVDMQPASKGVATNATPLEQVQFLRKDATAPPSVFAGVTAVEGNRNAFGVITFAAPQNYNLNDNKAYFLAYHPKGTVVAGVTAVWAINGATDILLSSVVYDAGKYSTPYSNQTMVFNHVLAKLRVHIRTEPGADVAELRNYYGVIHRVELRNTPTTATYTYSANQVTFSSNLQTQQLLQQDCQTSFSPTEIPATDGTQIYAAGMYAPAASNMELYVVTEKQGAIPVSNTLAFDAGKEHTVTVTFSAVEAAVAVSNIMITQWTSRYDNPTTIEPI